MNRKQKIKLTTIFVMFIVIATAIGLILYALKQNINLFYTPTQLRQAHIQPNQIVRLGGYVKEHSVQYAATGTSVQFVITDKQHDILVTFSGVLPNLFREGQGVVVTGKLSNQHILAGSEVLAKHDEKYMPEFLLKNTNQRSKT